MKHVFWAVLFAGLVMGVAVAAIGSGISGNAAAQSQDDEISVSCSDIEYVCCRKASGKYWELREMCEGDADWQGTAENADGTCGYVKRDEKPMGGLSCTVRNFQLPQDVSSAEEWIKGYGDPQFLVYWQNFPMEEARAWEGHATWAENIFDIAFTWWGAGKVFRVGKEAVKYTIRSVGSSLKAVARKAAVEGFVSRMEKEGKESVLREIGSKALSGMSKEDVARLAKTGLKVTPVFIGGALLDSITRKYVEYPDALVLKSPYDDPIAKELGLTGEPIFNTENMGQFYAASPCKADLNVRKYYVDCADYAYDMVRRTVYCEVNSFGETRQNTERECDKLSTVSELFPAGDETPRLVDSGSDLRIFGGGYVVEPLTGLRFGIRDEDKETLGEPTGSSQFVGKVLDSIGYRMEDGSYRDFALTWDNARAGYEGSDLRISLIDPCRLVRMNDDNGVAGDCYNNRLFIESVDVEVKDAGCSYCHDFEEKLEGIEKLLFYERPSGYSDETGEIESMQYNELIQERSDGYTVMFRDMGSYIEGKVKYQMDDLADMIGIEKGSWLKSIGSTLIGFDQFPNDVILKDSDFDGSFDIKSIESCGTVGIGVSVVKDENYEDSNFCYAKESTARKAFRWAPEIGGVLGGIGGSWIPGLGTMTGAGAGYRLGAVVFTGYVLYEKAFGSETIWPGT